MIMEKKGAKALIVLAPAALAALLGLLTLLNGLLELTGRQIDVYMDDLLVEDTDLTYNKYGLLVKGSLSGEPIADTGDALAFSDRVVAKLEVAETAAADFALRVEALRRAVGYSARMAVLPIPKRAQFEPLLAQSAGGAYAGLLKELARELPTEVALVDAQEGLAADSAHFLFYRTHDTWTMDGAYYGYKGICEALGLTPFDIDFFQYFCINSSSGTLKTNLRYRYSDSDPELKEALSAIPGDPLIFRCAKDFRNYEIFYPQSGEAPYKRPVILHTVAGNVSIVGQDMSFARLFGNGTGNLLVIADSAGKYFTPYLTEHFENVIFVDVERCPTDTLIELLAENDFQAVVVAQSADRAGIKGYSRTLNGLLE